MDGRGKVSHQSQWKQKSVPLPNSEVSERDIELGISTQGSQMMVGEGVMATCQLGTLIGYHTYLCPIVGFVK